jgi:hypothetical protein
MSSWNRSEGVGEIINVNSHQNDVGNDLKALETLTNVSRHQIDWRNRSEGVGNLDQRQQTPD